MPWSDIFSNIRICYLLTYSIVQNIIWKADCHSAYKRNPFFMEHEVSSPCSQKPATGPYPEPTNSTSIFKFSSHVRLNGKGKINVAPVLN